MTTCTWLISILYLTFYPLSVGQSEKLSESGPPRSYLWRVIVVECPLLWTRSNATIKVDRSVPLSRLIGQCIWITGAHITSKLTHRGVTDEHVTHTHTKWKPEIPLRPRSRFAPPPPKKKKAAGAKANNTPVSEGVNRPHWDVLIRFVGFYSVRSYCDEWWCLCGAKFAEVIVENIVTHPRGQEVVTWKPSTKRNRSPRDLDALARRPNV